MVKPDQKNSAVVKKLKPDAYINYNLLSDIYLDACFLLLLHLFKVVFHFSAGEKYFFFIICLTVMFSSF